MLKTIRPVVAFLALALVALPISLSQEDKKDPDKKDFFKKDFFGKGGPFGGGVRKLVKDFDKDGDGRLNTEERKAAREAAKRGGKGGFGPGKGGFKGGFGPGGFLTKPFLEAADADKDGKLTRDEISAVIKAFVATADKDKSGKLSEAQLLEALEAILPRPKGFPFPGKELEGKGPDEKKGPDGKKDPEGKDPFGKGGFPPKGGFFGSPARPLTDGILARADTNKDGKVSVEELMAATEKLFKESDQDKDGKLDDMELSAAISTVMPPPKFGRGGGFGGKRDPAKPGPRVTPAEVKNFPDAGLYDPTILRTIFIDFEAKDWESELEDFYKTDVEIPVTITVDGKKYTDVGVHFRGMSSFGMTPAGYKRSLNLSMDFVNKKQRLYGYKTLNLLNSAGDSSLMSTVLYSHIARQHMAAPKANFVKVVINGECWGIYVNVQQFNKEFTDENFKTGKGARWKVPGSPGGDGGLSYHGENISDYKRRYDIKTDDKEKDWKALINLCKVLNTTPADKLEKAIEPILDVDGVLWFLALDVALVNSDGYWTRASDYSIYKNPKGKFHIVPHDMNEAFSPGFGGFGPGMGKGPPDKGKGPADKDKGPDKGFGKGDFGKGGFKGGFGGGGTSLDPLVGLEDARKPLRSKLLAVPAYRKKYLEYVRIIAEKDLDWKNLGPIVARGRGLIEKEVAIETRKLSSLEAFQQATDDAAKGRGLKSFAEQRRTYLLSHPEIKKLAAGG